MKIKFNLKREIKIGAAIIVVLVFIAFTERRQGEVSIKDIKIRIENVHDNHFLDEGDVAALMQLNQQNLQGASIDKVDLKAIEKKIKSDPFIKDAEMYTDLKGNIVVRVELRRPIARIVRNDGPDGYIAEDGTVMPVSERFTSRVVLVSGSYVRKLLQQDNAVETDEGKQLMEMLHFVRNDEFWNAQIAQMDIDSKLKVTLFPQVGDEKIEFGTPDNLDVKFKKLKIFYKEILPRMGWNKYERVNLEYEGQIVAQ
jgi:cell division protein FtsQ